MKCYWEVIDEVLCIDYKVIDKRCKFSILNYKDRQGISFQNIVLSIHTLKKYAAK